VSDFGKMHKYKISRKPVQWEPSCSMRTYRQTDIHTDMAKLTVAFHNFVVTSKIHQWNEVHFVGS